MSKLTGKVAIVTGASKGIGAGIAKALAAAGANVTVNYANAKDDAQRVAAEIGAAGGKAHVVQGDVSKPTDIARLFSETKKAFGSLDILVNNAGVYKFEPLEAVREAEYRRTFDVNVLGTLLATQEAAKHFGPQGGSVINISSIVGRHPIPGAVVYNATKGAVDTITRTLAKELAPRNIRVNAIAPGATETEGFHLDNAMEKQIVANTPLGRLGKPQDISGAAVFLGSEDANWITGEILMVSGGL